MADHAWSAWNPPYSTCVRQSHGFCAPVVSAWKHCAPYCLTFNLLLDITIDMKKIIVLKMHSEHPASCRPIMRLPFPCSSLREQWKRCVPPCCTRCGDGVSLGSLWVCWSRMKM